MIYVDIQSRSLSKFDPIDVHVATTSDIDSGSEGCGCCPKWSGQADNRDQPEGD